jgi:hypothetical protein
VRNKNWSGLAIAIAAGLAVTACSSSGSAGAPGIPAPSQADGAVNGAAGGQTCRLAPASLVGSTLGVRVGEPRENDNDPVTICTYPAAADPAGVVVRFRSGADPDSFAAGKLGFSANGQPTRDVSGFADEAYTTSRGATTTLVARKGEVEILVTAKAPISHEKALAQKLFDAV